MRRMIAILLCLALGIALAGCSMGLGDILILRRAYEQISRLESFSFRLTGSLEGSAGQLPLDLGLEATGDCLLDPFTLMADIGTDMAILGGLELPIYLHAQGDELEILVGLGQEGEQIWLGNSYPLEKAAERDPAAAVQTILSILQEDPDALASGESQDMDGVKVRPFTITVPGDLICQALSLEPPESRSLEAQELRVWIGEKDGRPVRLEADFKDLLELLLEGSRSAWLPDLTISALPVTMDITAINSVDQIPLPET